MQVNSRGSIAPIEGVAIEIRWSATKLFEREIGLVGFALQIIFQRVPRYRIVMHVGAEKAAMFDHGVASGTGDLVEHQTLDGADFLTVAAVDWRAFNAVTGNQHVGHCDLRPSPTSRGRNSPFLKKFRQCGRRYASGHCSKQKAPACRPGSSSRRHSIRSLDGLHRMQRLVES